MQKIAYRCFGFVVYYACFLYFLILLPMLGRRETEKTFRDRLRKATHIALQAFDVHVRVIGREQLIDEPNAIIVANHSSWFDQMALVASLDVPVTFVANQKYFRYPGLGGVLRRLGAVPVFGSKVTESLQQCRDALDAGKWLVVYPEGTRSDSLLPFRRKPKQKSLAMRALMML